MSAALSNTLVSKKQGIVSILGSDAEIPTKKAAASLRRTLSADMSSRKWMTESGISVSPMKRVSSSEKLAVPISDSSSSSSSEEEGESQSDIWAAIQKNKKDGKQGGFDIWSSIVGKDEVSNSSPPYVHPLVKRSKSCLSEKSLEICTESLGSETGSDGFSPSENGESEEEQKSGSEFEELRVAKYNYAAIGKKLPQRSFPPPIKSISQNDGGVTVRMTSRRNDGRLVLEAVSVPSQNNFLAQRCDGRLVLTFSGANPENEGEIEDQIEEDLVQFEEKMDFEEESEDEEFAAEMAAAPKTLSGPINFHRLAPMVKKNPTWANKFSGKVEYSEEDEKINPIPPLARSLPPRPPGNRKLTPPQAAVGGAAGSLNGYEFFWRPKPMTKDSGLKPNDLKSPVALEQQWGLVPLGCKEPRRSIQFWGPHCIAT